MMTPPESLFLQFGTGLMALLSDACCLHPQICGKDTHPRKNRVSPNTVSIAAPEWIEVAKNFNTSNTKVNYELSNETNFNPVLKV
jgi:hypothetical protein